MRAFHNASVTMTSAPTRAVLLAIVLAAPFVFLSTLLLLHIEPPFGELVRGQPDQVNVLGSGIVFGALGLAVIALALDLRELGTARKRGAAQWPLAIAVLIFAYLALFVGAFIVDQLPCWRGVPNCD
jgi:hypothetical protein